MIGSKKGVVLDINQEVKVIPAEKQKVIDEQRAKEIEKLEEAKIRIGKQEEMEKNKDMADEIRTAAHGEARKRNKSQDNAAHEINADEESKPKSFLI